MNMLQNILSIIANIVYFVVLNLEIYTDRAPMPGGEIREWRRSPFGRLGVADDMVLVYLQILFAAVSIISSVLLMFGAGNERLRKVQRVSTIASTAVFIIIMIVTSMIHAKYA